MRAPRGPLYFLVSFMWPHAKKSDITISSNSELTEEFWLMERRICCDNFVTCGYHFDRLLQNKSISPKLLLQRIQGALPQLIAGPGWTHVSAGFVKATFTHTNELRALVTMKLWEPERKCPKAVVPRHFRTHGVWSSSVVWSQKWPGNRPNAISTNFYSRQAFIHGEI